ncbi:RNA polymerase sigma-I factor [Bacillus toyonensis]|uniref:RNA polymerase sigma-I factor n=1 Tax=Bacillus toyonensis TaxID=155322 RepID=UPI00399D41C6
MMGVAKLFLKFGKKKNSLEESIIRIQSGDTELQNQILKDYTPFISSTVSSVCKRFIEDSDDEFSIGLIAFNEALEKYSLDKGASFIDFATLIIKRKVIDYIRSEASYQNNHPQYGLDDFQEVDEEESNNTINSNTSLVDTISIDEHKKIITQQLRKEEILHYQQVLGEFNLTFSDLVENSPKHSDTRKTSIEIASFIADNPDLKDSFFKTKKIPMKEMLKLTSYSKKIIERNRRFIVAVVIILTGDYLYLGEHLKSYIE